MSPLYGEDNPTQAVTVQHPCRHHRDDGAELRPSRRIGYARLHTAAEQPALHNAVQALLACGVTAEHVHTDQGTRAPASRRPGWQDVTADLRPGDVLVALSLAGLARSRAELRRLISELADKVVKIELVGNVPTEAGSVLTTELLEIMRMELVSELAGERDFWRAHSDGRRGRHHRRIDPERELALIEAFDAGGNRKQLAVEHGVSQAQLYRVAGAVADGF